MTLNVSDILLTPRHIKAGLCTSTDGEFIYLSTKGGRRIGVFMMHTDSEFVQQEAEKYLSEIDYQE
jgi:hypothetical protein